MSDVKDNAKDDATDDKPREPDLWDKTGDWLAAHGALPALAVITIAVAIIHLGVFRGEPVGDDLSFHFAESARLADCLRAFDFDFWNPSANGGYASAYYYQVVPQLASAIPAAIFGHHLFWFELSVWLPHVLAPAAAYRGMRLVGATPWQAALAAFAIGFMNGESRWGAGNAGTFQVGLYTQTWALAAFPLALGYSVKWITERTKLPQAVAWFAFMTLCHPFAGIVLGMGLAASVVARALPRLRVQNWSTIVGRALVIVGVLELVVLPRPWAQLWFLPEIGPLPEWIAWILGGLAMAAGFALMLANARHRDDWIFADRRDIGHQLLRTILLGVLMTIACLPLLAPLLVDMRGFGGFPHRVWDEVGPGFAGLADWYRKGALLDFKPPDIERVAVLTWLLPLVLLWRIELLRWLWPGALIYAILLGLGPHVGKIGDDLFPPVRALGAMQCSLALGIGVGTVAIGRILWDAPSDSPAGKLARGGLFATIGLLGASLAIAVWASPTFVHRVIAIESNLRFTLTPLATRIVVTVLVAGGLGVAAYFGPRLWAAFANQYWMRTALSAVAAALLVLVAIPGARALQRRVAVLEDYDNSHADEMAAINKALAKQPPGRKQTGPGAENHWWNLLSYVYERVPSTLQMGGGGLQASPNYDFLWWGVTSLHDYLKMAWVYDAPYIVFAIGNGGKVPDGEMITRTEHYELRRLPAPGLVSPVHVVGHLDLVEAHDPFGIIFGQLHKLHVDLFGVLPPGYHSEQAGHQAAIDWLRGNQPMRDEVIAYTGSGLPGPPPDGKLVRAWRQESPGDEPDIVAEVEAEKPTTFMIRESWHPRWHAYIDGEEVPVRRVTPDFPAVDVPPGKHTIALRFERPAWALLAWLAWPGVPLAAWLVLRRRERRKIPEARVVSPTA